MRSLEYRDVLIALSAANLLFLRVWRELLFANDVDAYWMPTFTMASYFAAILNVCWITVVLLCGEAFLRKARRPILGTIGNLAFLMLLVFPLDYARKVAGIGENEVHWISSHLGVCAVCLVGLATCTLYLLIYRLEQTVDIIRWCLLLLVPFAFMTIGQATYQLVVVQTQAETVTMEQDAWTARQGNGPRVVWLLFDELDSRLAFSERPSDVALPSFDRFRAESVVALNGKSHKMSTSNAIPSYFTGKLVSKAKPGGRSDLLLHFCEDPPEQYVSLAESATMFDDMRTRGRTSCIVGLYHPYDRLFGDKVGYSSAYTLNTYAPFATDLVGAEMWSQLLGITPLSGRINAIRYYRGILKETLERAGDPKYDLVYIHVPVPHGPNIYRRKKNRFSLVNFSKRGYLDNLVLADRFLGEVRRLMEESGEWDSAVILVTSDHELRRVEFGDRKRVHKIPFLIKMPGQREQIVFEDEFSPTLVTRDLFTAVAEGRVETPSDIVEWLKREAAAAAATDLAKEDL